MTTTREPKSPSSAELRELDAQIERLIIGKCPHPMGAQPKQYGDGWKCPECEEYFFSNFLIKGINNYYGCPAYTEDWRAIFERLIPAMRSAGWLWQLREYQNGKITARFYRDQAQLDFGASHWAEHEDGRIAIVKAALQAVDSQAQK